MVDGKRVWLVSGRIPYARVARESWEARIQAAKQAGLNTIETPVFWNRHETRPGRFDFTGENDLRHFVDLVGKAGMYCILGLGPYVGSDWDMGGLPAFLRENPATNFRTNNTAYLEACSRFISAVADQIRGWQVTAPGTGGPIILLQCESEWTCGHDTLAAQYLGELTRYIRESGLSVPIVNSNNLWQSVEGQIDAWAGAEQLLGVMRQLAKVREGHPRMVIDLAAGSQDCWGSEPKPTLSPRQLERALAQTLAGGGQFNLTTFCGGVNPGFFGGRCDDSPASFACQNADRGCVLDAGGATTDLFPPLKRMASLASRFARLFSALDPSYQPVALSPVGGVGGGAGAGVSIVHTHGAQGGVAFLFAEEGDAPAPTRGQAAAALASRAATLLLADGTELRVPLGAQPVAACLLDTNVSPRCHLDYANVTALGAVSGASGAILVAYGPPGAQAVVSVNGSPVEAQVPELGTDQPRVLVHEGLAIVLVRWDQTPLVTFGEDAVYVGAVGLSSAGQPLAPTANAKQCVRVGLTGEVRSVAFEHAKRTRNDAVSFSGWASADQEDYTTGQSPRFASIPGIAGLAALGAPTGYGWYRFQLTNDKASSVLLDPAAGGDRFHIFGDKGKFLTLAGVGPGATAQAKLSLHKGEQTLVVLAENLGRFSGGLNVGEPKGLVEDLFEVEPLRLGKFTRTTGEPVALLPVRAPLWDVAEGDTTVPDRMSVGFKLAAKQRLLLRIARPPALGLLILNGKPLAVVDRTGPSCIVVPQEATQKGANTLELTVVSADQVADLGPAANSMTLMSIEGGLAARAELAFARWERPGDEAFRPLAKARPVPGQPCWFRAQFELRHAQPLYFEPIGLTKGQFFVNGVHVGRYFVATKAGKPVPPQARYFVPGACFRAGQANELAIFDEHGAAPTRVKLTP